MDPEEFCRGFSNGRAIILESSLTSCLDEVRKNARNAFAFFAARESNPDRREKFVDCMKNRFGNTDWMDDLTEDSFYFVGRVELVNDRPEEAIKCFDKIPHEKKHQGVWHDLSNALMKKYSSCLPTHVEMARLYLALEYCLEKALEKVEDAEHNAQLDQQLKAVVDTNARYILQYNNEDYEQWMAYFDEIVSWEAANFTQGYVVKK